MLISCFPHNHTYNTWGAKEHKGRESERGKSEGLYSELRGEGEEEEDDRGMRE